MSRKIAVIWHASFSIAAAVLYFFFILPRWPELRGTTSHTLGTVLRIVAGSLIGLAALPVVFTLLRTRRPELGTPQLALTLRTSSVSLHVLSGVLIIGTAISEIWLNLDSAGRWLFGIYGAAAAIALLGIFAFYLAHVAELPPPAPKPLKPKADKRRRRRRRKDDEGAQDDGTEPPEAPTDDTAESDETADADKPSESDEPAEVTAEEPEGEKVAEDKPDENTSGQVNGDETRSSGLRNRRSPGKISLRKRRRSQGGIALED